jgi:hypothetical protein
MKNQNNHKNDDELLNLIEDITTSGTTGEVDILGDPIVSFDDCLIRKVKQS